MQRALDAARGLDPEPLSADLRKFVDGYLSGATAHELLHAFATLARLPVDAAPLQVDEDVLLFESSRTSATLVRQFSLVDDDHDYDHIEHVQCLLTFADAATGEALDAAILWSSGEVAVSVVEVEATLAFVVIRSRG
jgi:hypothetical protein